MDWLPAGKISMPVEDEHQALWLYEEVWPGAILWRRNNSEIPWLLDNTTDHLFTRILWSSGSTFRPPSAPYLAMFRSTATYSILRRAPQNKHVMACLSNTYSPSTSTPSHIASWIIAPIALNWFRTFSFMSLNWF
jgi:hypothetical protein